MRYTRREMSIDAVTIARYPTNKPASVTLSRVGIRSSDHGNGTRRLRASARPRPHVTESTVPTVNATACGPINRARPLSSSASKFDLSAIANSNVVNTAANAARRREIHQRNPEDHERRLRRDGDGTAQRISQHRQLDRQRIVDAREKQEGHAEHQHGGGGGALPQELVTVLAATYRRSSEGSGSGLAPS